MKVVLDTNVFISGMFWKGNSNKIINSWKERKFELVSSLDNIKELIKVLRDFKIKMDERLVKEWITLIIENSILVDVTGNIKVVKDDPTDDKFIETAMNSNADYIITQDKHLLDIQEFEKIKIVTPEVFLRILKT